MTSLVYFFVALFAGLTFVIGEFSAMIFWVTLFILLLSMGLIVQPKSLGSGFLIRASIALYAMTFLPLFENAFINFPDYAWAFPKVQGVMADSRAPIFILMIGITGLAGMLLGISLVHLFHQNQAKKIPNLANSKTTKIAEKPMMTNVGFLTLGIILSIFFTLVTPSDTILTMSYGELVSSSTSAIEGFAGFGYLVYVLMIIMWLDLEKRRLIFQKNLFLEIFFFAFVSYVTIYCNLLRGGRSIASTIMAIGILYLTTPLPREGNHWSRLRKLTIITLPILIIFSAFTTFRANYADSGLLELTGGSVRDSILNFHKSGAWMGGLFGCYGMADEYFGIKFEFLHGQTYLDYILSLPPSPIANLLHYTRPIEGEQGPSWWYMGYTVGGMSQVIVPFKNFGIIGVFFHMMIVGSFLAYVEWKQKLKAGGWRILYGALFVSLMHWFWYGDMYIIRALMITGLWYFLLKFIRFN